MTAVVVFSNFMMILNYTIKNKLRLQNSVSKTATLFCFLPVFKDIEASRMFYLWICLSLFFALQSTVSSDQGNYTMCVSKIEVLLFM